MKYTTEGIKAVLIHQVERRESACPTMVDAMTVELMKEAVAHLNTQGATIYRLQAEKEKAEKAYQETFRALQATQSELSMLKTLGQPKEQAYFIHEPPLTNNGVKIADINTMVERFLQWKLPNDFRPDNGISYEPTYKASNGEWFHRNPTGTNLFTAVQARAMVKHMLGIKE